MHSWKRIGNVAEYVAFRSLKLWAALARRKIELRQLLAWKLAQRRIDVKKSVLTVWRHISREKILRGARLTDAWYYHCFVVLSTCIRAMCSHAKRQSQKRIQLHVCQQHARITLLEKSVVAWCQHTAARTQKNAVGLVADGFRRNQLLRSSLLAWRSQACQAVSSREQASCHLHHA